MRTRSYMDNIEILSGVHSPSSSHLGRKIAIPVFDVSTSQARFAKDMFRAHLGCETSGVIQTVLASKAYLPASPFN